MLGVGKVPARGRWQGGGGLEPKQTVSPQSEQTSKKRTVLAMI